jgi:hypothetical protein
MSQAYCAGSSRGYNTTTVEVRSEPLGLSQTIVLRKQAGQPVRQGGEAGGALRMMLNNINKNNEFVSFAIYPDSYAEFNYIKGLVTGLGIDYNWLPMEANEALIIVKSDSATAL